MNKKLRHIVKKTGVSLLLAVAFTAIFTGKAFGEKFEFNRAELSVNYGFLAPHSPDMLHLYQGNFPIYKLSFSGLTAGSRDWHQLYRFPRIGVDLTYSDLIYPEVLGKAFAIMPNITFSIFQYRSFKLGLKNGLGLGYLTKKYHRLDNYRNTAIGSNINLALFMGLEGEFALNNNINITTGVGLSHYSNGRTQMPNKGINIPSAKLGVTIGHPDKQPALRDRSPDSRESELMLVASGGSSAVYPIGSEKSPRAGITALYNIPVNIRHKLGFGYDMFYYYNREHLLSHLDEVEHIQWHFNHGVYISFQLDFCRTAFFIQKGVYLYDKHDFQQSLFYHRVGFRHNVYKNLMLNLSLKTHFFRAQFIEMGVGYKIF